MRGMPFQILGQEDPLEKELATHSSNNPLLVISHGQRSPVGYSPWGLKSQTQ